MKNELIFKRVKCEVIPNTTSCGRCGLVLLIPGGDECEVGNCEPGYNYKLVEEEPGKIQTEYEHIQERCDLIEKQESINYTPDEFARLCEELEFLKAWLKDNKPENWVLCNTVPVKAGDTVIINKHSLRTVEKFCLDGSVLLYNKDEDKSFLISNLDNYYINVAGNE